MDELKHTLSLVLKYNYPFGKDKMTHAELFTAVDAVRLTMRYLASQQPEWPDDEVVLLVLLAFTVRQLGKHNRDTAARSRGIFSLLYKSNAIGLTDNNADNALWKSMFDNHFATFQSPPAGSVSDLDYYPGPTSIHCKNAIRGESFRRELHGQLYGNAGLMLSAKLLSIKEPSWSSEEAVNEKERQIVERLGFLFQSYRPYIWYFEVVEVVSTRVLRIKLFYRSLHTCLRAY